MDLISFRVPFFLKMNNTNVVQILDNSWRIYFVNNFKLIDEINLNFHHRSSNLIHYLIENRKLVFDIH